MFGSSVFIFTANAAPLLYYTDLTSALCRSKNPPLVSCLCFSFTDKTDLKVNSVQVPQHGVIAEKRVSTVSFSTSLCISRQHKLPTRQKKRRRNNQPLYCNNPVCVCLCFFLHYVLPSVVPLLLVDGACLDFVIVSLCNAAEPEREWALRTPQQYCDG